VRHGTSGSLSDDPAKLCKYARMLIEDRRLAELMGSQARKTVIEKYSLDRFKAGLLRSIEIARAKWAAARHQAAKGCISSL